MPGESVSYAGAAGKNVQAWIVKPPGFDLGKKYPLLVLIHGGPQGVWKFLMRYAPPETRTQIQAAGVTAITRSIPWNWELNQVTRPPTAGQP